MKMKIELMDVEETLLEELEHSVMKKDIAVTYAFAIVSTEKINWPRVNVAIRQKWGVKSLIYIKKLAWKLVEKGI